MSKLEIDSGIIELAIKIRQKSNIHVVDALIASTCIQHDLTLLTRNVEDFQKIAKLRMQNPIDK